MAELQTPLMHDPRPLTDDWTVLPSWLPVPGMGALAVNAFVLKGAEPLLVDTGALALGEAFLAAAESVVALEDLRWIWISHLDLDHVGNLAAVLERAPKAHVLTNFLGQAKMQLAGRDVSRVRLLEPGKTIEASGHRLHAVRPPYYDAPETVGFFDATERVWFAADAFGAVLPEPVDEVREVAGEALREGLLGWSAIDAPWLAHVDASSLDRTLSAVERLDPAHLLSGHLPVSAGGVGRLTRHVRTAYGRGPDGALDPLSMERLLERLECADVPAAASREALPV